MKILLAAAALLLVPSVVEAEDILLLHPVQVAECSLESGGKNLWSGKCCVDMTAAEVDKGFEINVNAMSWRACLYDKNHPGNASLPTFKQTCLGPWINIDQDAADKTFSAQWSIADNCHGSIEDSAEAITKTGQGTFEGKNFRFSWKVAN